MKFAVIGLAEKRVNQKDIAVKLTLSKSAVSNIIKNFKINARCRIEKRGSKPKYNDAGVSILQRIVIKTNMKPLYVSLSVLRENHGYKICIKTARKYLNKVVIRNYKAVPKPYLCPCHILAQKR